MVFPEARDKLGTAHAGHEVVGDDEIDLCGKLALGELLQGALRAKYGNDEVPGSPEDGLTGSSLNGVVINQEDRRGNLCRH